MALTQITADSIADGAVTAEKISQTVSLGGGGGPKITAVEVTDSNYTVLDDTAVALDGGYVKITGSGFATGVQVLVNNTPATSTQFVSSTTVHAQLPAKTAGSYVLYLVNSDGGVAISVAGVTYSEVPTWTTSSSLPDTVVDNAFSIQLQAPPASVFTLAADSTLPPGTTLSSSGLLSGTVTGLSSNTTYTFTVTATDSENQDSPRTFALPVNLVAPTGQVQYTTPSIYSWTVPTGVTSVSAVLIGGGGTVTGTTGGGGGGLRYINDLPVTPGETLTVVVAAAGENSSLIRSGNSLVVANGSTDLNGGQGSTLGAGSFGGTIGGGNGGSGQFSQGTVAGGGGGGAGGYSANGGYGGIGGGAPGGTTNNTAGTNGNGGGGGGGGGGIQFTGGNSSGGGGGGTGIFGQGSDGVGGARAPGGGGSNNTGRPGNGGSSGSAGFTNTGGTYGGGGGGRDSAAGGSSQGASGAVRIIWGPDRAFPSTNTADL